MRPLLPETYEVRTNRSKDGKPLLVRAEEVRRSVVRAPDGSPLCEREEGSGRTILRGHFATFMQPYDLGYCMEQVDPHAFDRTLKERPDVLALLNHDSAYPLARTTATKDRGKLSITIDDSGPVCEFEPTDTQYARDLIANVDAGVVTAMSFGFDIRSERMEKLEDGKTLFTLLDVELWECSVVLWGANPRTDVQTQRRALRESMIAEARQARGRRIFLAPMR